MRLTLLYFFQVDYSAHIAHRFLLEPGDSRTHRIQSALQNIGPAVANGGITTTLAFILLAGSKSHVFSTFFKIFFLVVSFGLWHGLATLPVLLAIFGPNSQAQIESFNIDDLNEDCEDEKIKDMPETTQTNLPNNVA